MEYTRRSTRSIIVRLSDTQKSLIEQAIADGEVNNTCESCNEGTLSIYKDHVVVAKLNNVKNGYTLNVFGACDNCKDGSPMNIDGVEGVFSSEEWRDIEQSVIEQNA
jgi:hypothetical protein